ncbi:hypothetical protein HY642_02480 [Candidatus Woesearchaeota archaeon]|nr:hypothetical protein [Candidatus Woesearchaeota archaeon]
MGKRTTTLGDTPPEKAFYARNGEVYKNLLELADALPRMPKETFDHHVNLERNDFHNWVDGVFGDSRLAKELLAVKTQEAMARKITKRVKQLKA